ncbi:hypothetical protein TTHERM_00129490 (macronuclear) [Tetrahymena thermophila SB210]|uniref:DUF4246 domain-containing protein n=1 Tax=Tetrahymena thermophila (strain SB210) TaxID=312017 RepID=I7MJC1_TETTS|nr:hypothetical protein TTHERM_00129490 [Tetrahymena thermophila SB210]EAR96172.2 hypothetical protein TTHERM_00129490 [Tetrahymena thermophila SB210]|eukprot:XP_001016417.2 hypothetical protein TTHERM_00129490 [Tetrahymena thermophila SB210]
MYFPFIQQLNKQKIICNSKMLNLDKNRYIDKIYRKSADLTYQQEYGYQDKQSDNQNSQEESNEEQEDDKWERRHYKFQNESKQYCKSVYEDIKLQKANDVYIFEQNPQKINHKLLTHKENYIIYERKDNLLKAINKIMLFQEQNNLIDYHPNINSISGQIKELVQEKMKNRKTNYYPQEEDEEKEQQQQNTADIVKVRNIIHQSLQPYHKDYIKSDQSKQIEAYFKEIKEYQGIDQWGKQYKTSQSEFLWLPAVFKYSKKKKMYEIEGKLFNLLEKCPDIDELKLELNHLMTYFSTPLQQTHDYFKKLEYKISNEFNYDRIKILDNKSKVNFSQQIHAIVKISEIEIAPKSTYSGKWHVEGFSSDNILYTCLYVIEHDENLVDGKLKFKRTPRSDDDPCGGSQMQSAHQYCPSYNHLCDPHKLIPLGSLDIKENLMIIFPNQNIHKVKGIKNVTDKPLKRKIVVFFVVNHKDQPYTINDVEFTKPLEFIKEYRLRDMYERSLNKQTEAQSFDYCEH